VTQAPDRRVFIVLGLYRPDLDLLSRQLDSLVSQTYRNVEILVCVDGPHDPDLRAVSGGFSRFPVHVVEFDTRIGVHANFARGLRQAVAASRSAGDLFAFCDQDNSWHPTKLERQVACFSDPQTALCHCDARIVSRRGEVLAESLFEHETRPRSASFVDLLVMNSVTGMTTLFRRDVAEAAEPFPLLMSRHVLHDHWIALVASLLGSVRFIDAPLVDYTQHAENVMGARPWQGSPPRRGAPLGRRAYLRKCYREYIWRRRALDELRQMLGHTPGAAERLRGRSVRDLFDCDASPIAGPALTVAYLLRGPRRRADQTWRILRGRSLYCSARKRIHRQHV
jgi:glycosyltransferase involved in cell wall biosynthesis